MFIYIKLFILFYVILCSFVIIYHDKRYKITLNETDFLLLKTWILFFNRKPGLKYHSTITNIAGLILVLCIIPPVCSNDKNPALSRKCSENLARDKQDPGFPFSFEPTKENKRKKADAAKREEEKKKENENKRS